MGLLTPLMDFISPLMPSIGIPQAAFEGARKAGNLIDKKYIRDNTDEIATGAAKYLGQQQTNTANAAQAQRQMDFQASQTGTAYQRGVTDMKAAGLNPMLAYSQGGAQSGGGAQQQLGDKIGQGVSGAMQAATLMADITNKTADTHLKESTENINRTTPALQDAQRELALAQALREASQTRLSDATAKQVDQQVRNLMAEIEWTQLRTRLGKATFDTDVSTKKMQLERDKLAYGLEHETQGPKAASAKLGLKQQYLDYYLEKLGIPGAQNLNRYQQTPMGQGISPMLRDIVGLGRTGHSAASIYSLTGR